MKKMLATAIFSVFALMAGVSECRAENTWCTGEMGAVTVENLAVSGPCTLNGTTVEGNLNIESDGLLSATGVDIFGNFQADGAAGLQVVDCRIGGHLNIKNTYGGQVSHLIGNTVGGHVQLKENQSPFQLRDNSVNGHLKAFRNSGSVNLTGNLVGGNLLCHENDPTPTGSGNTVEGVREDQCVYLEPAMVLVPDVVGQLRTEAENEISSAYLNIGVAEFAANDAVAANHVIGQHPLGGALVQEGAAVDVLISSGPPPRVEIAAHPPAIQAGESSTLKWISTHAANASIEPEIGAVPVNGSMIVSPT